MGFSATALAARINQSLDVGWRFSLGDNPAAKSPSFDDRAWRPLDVPHDWSIEGNYDKANPTGDFCAYLPSGVGWYRQVIDMPERWKEQTVNVEFEGIYMNSQVWLNGEPVGGRAYGDSSFSCDLTSKLNHGRNVLSVRVDNSLEPSARWYHGCGIYGNVRLVITDPVHVPMSGIFVKTPTITDAAATVQADVEIKHDATTSAEIEVQTTVLTPEGEPVAQYTGKATVAARETGKVTESLNVKNPVRWSLESPTLYTVQTRILRAGKIVDEVSTPFGIRSLKFDPDKGLFLNGKSVKIQGVCEHQAASPVGAAVPAALIERRLQQLKNMGCNAIRVAHNPQLPAFYDLCDRMGILVLDEIFDGWHGKAKQDYGRRFFKTDWKKDVTDWVRRDRNHPSVIGWSIGNETGHADQLGISAVIKASDGTRPTTGGDVLNGVDVAGFNGRSIGKASALESFHQKNPQTPILLTEEPHTFQTRSFYQTTSQIAKSAEEVPPLRQLGDFSAGALRLPLILR